MDKTNFSKKAGLLMAGCLITLNAFGQATIKGQVVDATGEPVIGASILVKDTKSGSAQFSRAVVSDFWWTATHQASLSITNSRSLL